MRLSDYSVGLIRRQIEVLRGSLDTASPVLVPYLKQQILQMEDDLRGFTVHQNRYENLEYLKVGVSYVRVMKAISLRIPLSEIQEATGITRNRVDECIALLREDLERLEADANPGLRAVEESEEHDE